jgi:3-oxoacyl-[acyl-carrier-protein] synthase-3
MTREPAPIGLSGVAGVLPPRFRVLSDLAGDGLLTSPPEVLSGFGFDRAYVCDESCTVEHMARAAAQLALADAGLHSQQIDLLIWASARAENHVCTSPAAGDGRGSLLDGFRYSSAWLQHALELDHADVMAVAQQGCSTMFSALRVAQALLTAHPGRQHVLCVAADALPRGSHREILYNVISDAACAVVVSRGSTAERWVGCRQLSKGGYWDPSSCGPEIMIRLLGIPSDRIYQSLPSFGHTLTSDTFLFLQALRREKRLRPGARVLLFTYGFGSSWSAILLEH